MTVWRKWSTGQKSYLPQSARPTSRGESPSLSLHQVASVHCSFNLLVLVIFCLLQPGTVYVKNTTNSMWPLDRFAQSRGYRHRSLGTNHVLDRFGEGSHWGRLSGRDPAPSHYRFWSRQPPSYYHRPSQWVCRTFTLYQLLFINHT